VRAVASQRNGHDHSYPDIMPPAARFGGACDMQAFYLQAHAAGALPRCRASA